MKNIKLSQYPLVFRLLKGSPDDRKILLLASHNLCFEDQLGNDWAEAERSFLRDVSLELKAMLEKNPDQAQAILQPAMQLGLEEMRGDISQFMGRRCFRNQN